MNDVAIKVGGLTKIYRLYNDPVDRLKESLHPLRKKYHRDFHALNDVSFEIKKGETVGIIGKNGAGKSTLLKILTGVLTPSGGQVETHGKVLALLELGAGFNPELTGIENIYFNGALLGASKEEMDIKLDAILEFADIGDFVFQPVKTYSSGMTVRLAFAVIANMDADVLVVDEALAVGDAFFVQKCMRFLRNFKKNGTILFVSHDLNAVLNLCDRAIWLEDGLGRALGSPKELCEEYIKTTIVAEQGGVENNKVFSNNIDAAPQGIGKDQRSGVLDEGRFRNDIEVFVFDPEKESFGKGGAKITDVLLCSRDDERLSWAVGGEEVRVKISAHSARPLLSPIIGFFVKDRLGQSLFGDTTQLVDGAVLELPAGDTFVATFDFLLPLLPAGDYSICAAIAEGTAENHIQHHWIHDALMFKAHTSRVSYGLVGLPMQSITTELIKKRLC